MGGRLDEGDAGCCCSLAVVVLTPQQPTKGFKHDVIANYEERVRTYSPPERVRMCVRVSMCVSE